MSEELLMTRVEPDRVWPGRLLAAPYYGSFFRAVVLAVDEVGGRADVAYIDWGNRSSVPLYTLVELPPALVVGQSCSLMRMKLDGIIDDSIPLEFAPTVSDNLYQWLTSKVANATHLNSPNELRALCKRRNDLDGVPEFVVDVIFDERDDCWNQVNAARPKSMPRIRKSGVRTTL